MEGPKIPRKSCDFCYKRKIKCDGQKPRCSHCITYEMDCTYAALSRQSRTKNKRIKAKIDDNTIDLQTRLQHLESLVEQLTSDGNNTDHKDTPPKVMHLPPQQQVLSIVNTFLNKFNTVLPLFNAETLLRLIHDSYNIAPHQRDPVAWAAINVVLALAHRQGLVGSSNTTHSIEYLGRAQSVLSDVMLGDIQLLNIQVLVSMVILLQGSQDLQPASIMIGTTIRLAHKIGLHNRTSSAHLDPVLARQRASVFWMAYILDKDISLRTKQPSIQLDDDIDLDLPCSQSNEDRIDDASISTGIVTTADGTVEMNYFVSRIQLAVIEGGVYDYLYSTRSQKRSPEERSRALESVARALDQWKASIPPEFHGVEFLKRASPDIFRFLFVLNATSLLCTTCINQAHAWNAQWMTSLRKYERDGTVPMLPPRWEALVDEARDLMVLFGYLGMIDRWNFWITGCSYMTAMMLLTANSMHQLQHDKSSLDKQLVDAGLQTLHQMVEETQNEAMRSFQQTCAELHQHAQQRQNQAFMMANSQDFFLHSPEFD